MNLALRSSSARFSQSPAIFSLRPRRPATRTSTVLCFSSPSHAEQSPEMDTTEAKELPKEAPNENVMSHSFGEGYSTRSDEEGFGGIYGGNDDEALGMEKKDVHEEHPEYNREQGSEVKEKEKARHQTNVENK